MLISRRTISIEIPDEQYDENDEEIRKVEDRIEEILEPHLYNIKTDFDCVFGNRKDVTVTISISEY